MHGQFDVRAPKLRQTDMILADYLTPGADRLILDNLVGEIRLGSQRSDLVLDYSFNADGLGKPSSRGGAGTSADPKDSTCGVMLSSACIANLVPVR